VKRFGLGVELRLIRKVPRPEDYSDSDYNFYLKACEAMDIARKKTYVEHGGQNRLSPLIQALGHPMLECEMGRLGGRKAVESGQLARIRALIPLETRKKGGRIGGRLGGRRTTESGQLARIRALITPEQLKEAGRKGGRIGGRTSGRIQGRKNSENGHLASISAKGNCTQWNINRGKPCSCGWHY